jgi:hypothetical protein
MPEYSKGWYQVAFVSEIADQLSSVRIGAKRLILLRSNDHFRTFSGDCPHRGANLAIGGRVCGDAIICPFHGYKIGLGHATDQGFSILEHPTLCIGGMIFAQLGDFHYDASWPQYIQQLAEDHILIEGIRLLISAPMETVIENACDQRHFEAVHGVPTSAFTPVPGSSGEVLIESMFYVPLRAGTGGVGGFAPTPYIARVFSPGIAAVELRGDYPYTIITTATAIREHECVVRLTLALPKAFHETRGLQTFAELLIRRSLRGLEQDRLIWENINRDMQPAWTHADRTVQEFYQFCRIFEKQNP